MLRHPPINGSNTRCRSQLLSWSPVPLLTVKLQSRCKLVDLGVCRPGRQSCLGRGTLAHRLSPTTSGHIHGAAHRAASRPAAKPCAAGTWRVVPAPANAFEQTAVDRQHLTQCLSSGGGRLKSRRHHISCANNRQKWDRIETGHQSAAHSKQTRKIQNCFGRSKLLGV